MKFKAEMKYSNPRYAKHRDADLVEKVYYCLTGVYSEIFNKHINEWNEEYSGPYDGGEPDSVYDKWIAAKMAPAAEAITGVMKAFNYLTKLMPKHVKSFDVREGSCILETRFADDSTMWYEVDYDHPIDD